MLSATFRKLFACQATERSWSPPDTRGPMEWITSRTLDVMCGVVLEEPPKHHQSLCLFADLLSNPQHPSSSTHALLCSAYTRAISDDFSCHVCVVFYIWYYKIWYGVDDSFLFDKRFIPCFQTFKIAESVKWCGGNWPQAANVCIVMCYFYHRPFLKPQNPKQKVKFSDFFPPKTLPKKMQSKLK